jgi:hypothetical protein
MTRPVTIGHPFGLNSYVSTLRWFVVFLLVLLLPICTEVRAARIDRNVTQQQCDQAGGTSIFGIGRDGNLVYEGCATPDGPSDFGPLVDISVSAPRQAKPNRDISTLVHVTVSNSGDRLSPGFSMEVFMAKAPEMTNRVNFAPITIPELLPNQPARTFEGREVRIPPDRFGNSVICATASAPFVIGPQCTSIVIAKTNINDPH